jgi:bacteriocin-like protein
MRRKEHARMSKKTTEVSSKWSEKPEKKSSRSAKNQKVDFELSDEELDQVSGGSMAIYCHPSKPQQQK